ncbi:unnamed protein product [Symbiodinium natans]|uniref:Uncharacterized protein n=1 Tax=Symbiodinium natans TaxID=878477 RepID=A0A812R4K9_9DINO|nr:unnamed protein product [Symbiodinium natans]
MAMQSGKYIEGDFRRKRWADIDTDDEDGISHWMPAHQVDGVCETEGTPGTPVHDAPLDWEKPLAWDPVGLSSGISQPPPTLDEVLLQRKDFLREVTPGSADSYGKWSWSTGAASSETASEVDGVDDTSPIFSQSGLSPRVLLSTSPAGAVQRKARPSLMATPVFVAVASPSLPPTVFPIPCSPGYPALLQGSATHMWGGQEKQNKDLSSSALCRPPFGREHRFHRLNNTMGELDAGGRTFTVGQNKGRLSIVCTNRVHFQGIRRYAVQHALAARV